MKTCLKCNVKKEQSEFHKDKIKKDGFNIYCKLCVSVKNKAYKEWAKPEPKPAKNKCNHKKMDGTVCMANCLGEKCAKHNPRADRLNKPAKIIEPLLYYTCAPPPKPKVIHTTETLLEDL